MRYKKLAPTLIFWPDLSETSRGIVKSARSLPSMMRCILQPLKDSSCETRTKRAGGSHVRDVYSREGRGYEEPAFRDTYTREWSGYEKAALEMCIRENAEGMRSPALDMYTRRMERRGGNPC